MVSLLNLARLMIDVNWMLESHWPVGDVHLIILQKVNTSDVVLQSTYEVYVWYADNVQVYVCAKMGSIQCMCTAKVVLDEGVWCEQDTVMCATLEKRSGVKTKNVINRILPIRK